MPPQAQTATPKVEEEFDLDALFKKMKEEDDAAAEAAQRREAEYSVDHPYNDDCVICTDEAMCAECAAAEAAFFARKTTGYVSKDPTKEHWEGVDQQPAECVIPSQCGTAALT